LKLEEGKWHRIEVVMQLGKGRTSHEYTVAVTPSGGERRTFTLPLPKKFTAFYWIGIHSCGNKGKYYIDDFKIH
jgi:hypothetical protein